MSPVVVDQWRALVDSIHVGGTLPLTFRFIVSPEGRPLVRLSLHAIDATTGRPASFGKTYVLSDRPTIAELLWLAFVAYQHELCEQFYVAGVKPFNPHPTPDEPWSDPFAGFDFDGVGDEYAPGEGA